MSPDRPVFDSVVAAYPRAAPRAAVVLPAAAAGTSSPWRHAGHQVGTARLRDDRAMSPPTHRKTLPVRAAATPPRSTADTAPDAARFYLTTPPRADIQPSPHRVDDEVEDGTVVAAAALTPGPCETQKVLEKLNQELLRRLSRMEDGRREDAEAHLKAMRQMQAAKDDEIDDLKAVVTRLRKADAAALAAGGVGGSAHQRVVQRQQIEEAAVLEATNKELLSRLARQGEQHAEERAALSAKRTETTAKLEAQMAAQQQKAQAEVDRLVQANAELQARVRGLEAERERFAEREELAVRQMEELRRHAAALEGRAVGALSGAASPPACIATRPGVEVQTPKSPDVDAFFAQVAEHADRDVLGILIAVEEDRERKEAELHLLRKQNPNHDADLGPAPSALAAVDVNRPGEVEAIIKSCLDDTHAHAETSLLPLLVRLADDRQQKIEELASLRGVLAAGSSADVGVPCLPATVSTPLGLRVGAAAGVEGATPSLSPITVVRAVSASPQWSSPAGSRQRIALQATMLDKINDKLVARLEALEAEHEVAKADLAARTAELEALRSNAQASASNMAVGTPITDVLNRSMQSVVSRVVSGPDGLLKATGSAKDLTRHGLRKTIEELERRCEGYEQELAEVRGRKALQADQQLVEDLKAALVREESAVRARDVLEGKLDHERTRYGLMLQDIRNERDKEVADLRSQLDAALLDVGRHRKDRRRDGDRGGSPRAHSAQDVDRRVAAAARAFDQQRADDVAMHTRQLDELREEKDAHIRHLRAQLQDATAAVESRRAASLTRHVVSTSTSPNPQASPAEDRRGGGSGSVSRVRQLHSDIAERDAVVAQLTHDLRMERERIKDLQAVILRREKAVNPAGSSAADAARTEAVWRKRLDDLREMKDAEIKQLRGLVVRAEDREQQGAETLVTMQRQEREDTVADFTAQLQALRDKKQLELEAVLSKLQESEDVIKALENDVRTAERNAETALRRTTEHHEALRAKDLNFYNKKIDSMVTELTAENRALQDKVVATMEQCRARQAKLQEEREEHAARLADVTARAAEDVARANKRLAERDAEACALRAAMQALSVPCGGSADVVGEGSADGDADAAVVPSPTVQIVDQLQCLTNLVDEKEARIVALMREGDQARKREAEATAALASATAAFESTQEEAARVYNTKLAQIADALTARDRELREAKSAAAATQAPQLRAQIASLEGVNQELRDQLGRQAHGLRGPSAQEAAVLSGRITALERENSVLRQASRDAAERTVPLADAPGVTAAVVEVLRAERDALKSRCTKLEEAQGNTAGMEALEAANEELREKIKASDAVWEEEVERYRRRIEALEGDVARAEAAAQAAATGPTPAADSALEEEARLARAEVARLTAEVDGMRAALVSHCVADPAVHARTADDLEAARARIAELEERLACVPQEVGGWRRGIEASTKPVAVPSALPEGRRGSVDVDVMRRQLQRLESSLAQSVRTNEEKEAVITELEELLQGVAEANEATQAEGSPEERIAALQADLTQKTARIADLENELLDAHARLAVCTARAREVEAELEVVQRGGGSDASCGGGDGEWRERALKYEQELHEARRVMQLMEDAKAKTDEEVTQLRKEGSEKSKHFEALEARHRATLSELRRVESGSPRSQLRSPQRSPQSFVQRMGVDDPPPSPPTRTGAGWSFCDATKLESMHVEPQAPATRVPSDPFIPSVGSVQRPQEVSPPSPQTVMGASGAQVPPDIDEAQSVQSTPLSNALPLVGRTASKMSNVSSRRSEAAPTPAHPPADAPRAPTPTTPATPFTSGALEVETHADGMRRVSSVGIPMVPSVAASSHMEGGVHDTVRFGAEVHDQRRASSIASLAPVTLQELTTLEEECEEAADLCLNQLDAWQQAYQARHGADPPDLVELMNRVEQSLPMPRDDAPSEDVLRELIQKTESCLIELCDLGDRIEGELRNVSA